MSIKSAKHRAALLIQSLPDDVSHKLLSRLSSEERMKIEQQIERREQNQSPGDPSAIKKFFKDLEFESIECPEQKSAIHSHATQSNPFSFLTNATPELCNDLLKVEHPKNIAIVISFLPLDFASKIISLFEGNLRMTVISRLCRIANFDRENVLKLEETIQKRFISTLSEAKYQQTGLSIASKLLSCINVLERKRLLDILGEQDSRLSDKIRRRIFEFSALADLSDVAIKRTLLEVDTSLWAPSLKNAKVKLQRKILDNLAERPRLLLKKEIDSLEKIDYFIENQARLEIVKVVMNLVERRQIKITGFEFHHRVAA